MSSLVQLIRGSLKSKTMLFNGGVLLSVITALQQSEWLQGLLEQNPEYGAVFTGVVAIVNLLLRPKTKTPLAEKTSLMD